jgi:hypothetical protein
MNKLLFVILVILVFAVASAAEKGTAEPDYFPTKCALENVPIYAPPKLESSSPSGTFSVTNTNDDGPGSLRQAILDANATPGKDTINFNIGFGAQSIKPMGGLPTITDPVIIDGTTQPGFSTSPIIALEGVYGGVDGLRISAGGSLVQGLVINNYLGGAGIRLTTLGSNVIRGNYIGTDLTGAIGVPNGIGLLIDTSSHNTIGGTDASDRNVISGNHGVGVSIFRAEFNQLAGNYIGVNASGTGVLRNDNGIVIAEASNNLIGGSISGARNVISGNLSVGILVSGSSLGAASGNRIEGNYIGTNASGTSALSNGTVDGIYVVTADHNSVGGDTPGAGNLISGNAAGVKITAGAGNLVAGNYIGTDRTGTYAISNLGGGVVIFSAANTVIGGTTAAARNVISGNGSRGIWIYDSLGASGVQVQGNYIGTQADGVSPLGNASHGVFINNLAKGNTIGGQSGAGNVIAFNAGAGVANDLYEYALGNSILSNSIFANVGLGIDLFTDGVTPNDLGDLNNNGAQNFPVLTGAHVTGVGTNILGTLNSLANSSLRIEFFSSPACDPSGYGEGQTYLGATTVATDNGGNGTFDVILPVVNTGSSFLSATATNASNHTSEFSQCVQVTPPPVPVLLTEANSNRAIALDSVMMVRDPLPVVTENNFSLDQRTRVTLFAINVDPGPGEVTLVAQAEDAMGIHPLPIEYVGKVPNSNWLTEIVVKLPDAISGNGDVSVSIRFLGLTSNKVLLGIKAP